MSHSSSVREEFENKLEPLTEVPVERELSLGTQLWQQGWLRKGLILIVLAVVWEVVARIQNNDLMLPSFLQTSHALFDGLLASVSERLPKHGMPGQARIAEAAAMLGRMTHAKELEEFLTLPAYERL